MKDKRKVAFTIITVILAGITVALHLYEYPSIPNGFFYDESSLAYNSYSLLKTGADEYGNSFPVFFRCFDNFQDPVYVYTLVSFISIFGLEIWVARLPGLLFKFASSIALYFLAFRLTSSKRLSIITAFTFSILPWTFVLSRSSMGGYMPMLLGIILFVYYSLLTIDHNSIKYAIFSAISFAFTMYSHQIGRPAALLLVSALILSYNIKLLRIKKYILVFSAVLLLSLTPMIIYVIGTPESMTKRFSTFSIWKDESSLLIIATRFFSRYLDYFSPSFLFINGDSELRHHTNMCGQLYFVLLPFLAFGLWRIVKRLSKFPEYRFILLSIIFYPIAASLTLDRFHSTRCLNGVPFFCILAAIGLKTTLSLIRKKKISKKIFLFILLAFFFEGGIYFKNYFNNYPEKSRSAFNAPLVEIIQAAFSERKNDETIYVSQSLFHHPVDKDFKPVWYSHFLFFGKIDPARYQKEGIPPEIVSHYSPDNPPDQHGLLLRMNSKIVFDQNFNPYVVYNDEKIPPDAVILKRIPLVKDSDRFFELYRF